MSADGEQSPREQLDARLIRVERALDAITREVTAIRAALDARRAAGSTQTREPVSRAAFLAGLGVHLEAPSASSVPSSAPPVAAPGGEAAAAPPRARPAPARAPVESLDLESLLGRYGMLGIAVVAAAAAVGTFLSWAISKGYLTLPPGARVIVALVFAAGLGAWGFRIRKRERPFGSSMIGLALVIVLICAYAAGSWLRLVPPWVAFVGTVGVSWGLALFAHSEKDEPLWCVAFGGAGIAPFVTSTDEGNFYALVAYAAFLLFAACFALSHRAWPIAWRLFYVISAFYAIAAASMSTGEKLPAFYAAFALPVVVAAVGVLPFAPSAQKRPALRWLALLTVAVGFAAPRGPRLSSDAGTIAGCLLAAAVLWLLVTNRLGTTEESLGRTEGNHDTAFDWIDAALIPLTLCFQASSAVEPFASSVVVQGIATIVLVVFALRRQIRNRDAAVAACVIMALTVVFQLKLEEPTGRIVSLLGVAASSLVLNKARPSLAWIGASVATTVIAASLSLVALSIRPSYTYPPFIQEPSLTALWILVFLVLVSRFRGWIAGAMRPVMTTPRGEVDTDDLSYVRAVARAAPWVWAFLWVLIELAKAFSRTTSTLLLVIYFAATAIAAVAVGHVRRLAELRQLGLGLAVLAAATAGYGATTYFDVGARVLAYLVTSAFLLGIAYWYRRRGVASPA